MEFSFDFNSLKEPKKRLLLGMILLVFGIACVAGKEWNAEVAKDNCVAVEATFDECKYRSGAKGTDLNSIYLTFTDYDDDLDIHSSCTDDGLIQDLMELKSGTKMQLMVNEETRCIYELKVGGKTWLSLDDAVEKIDENMLTLRNIGYVLIVAGGLFVLTFIVSLVWKKINKK